MHAPMPGDAPQDAPAPPAPEAEEEPQGSHEPEQPQGPEGPRPLGVEVRDTGHPPVDAHLRRLADADHLPVGEHLGVYEDVHGGLRDTLAALDRPDGPQPPIPHRPQHP